MAYTTRSPLAAAADLLGELLESADPQTEGEEILAALASVRQAYERTEANLGARIREAGRERLTVIDGGGGDA